MQTVTVLQVGMLCYYWVTVIGSQLLGHSYWVTVIGSQLLGHSYWVTVIGSHITVIKDYKRLSNFGNFFLEDSRL